MNKKEMIQATKEASEYYQGIAKKSSTIHELKIMPQYFEEVVSGRKCFELRKNDRDYKVGDQIKLLEYENGEYTGREAGLYLIRYILKDCPEYGLKKGYCILGL